MSTVTRRNLRPPAAWFAALAVLTAACSLVPTGEEPAEEAVPELVAAFGGEFHPESHQRKIALLLGATASDHEKRVITFVEYFQPRYFAAYCAETRDGTIAYSVQPNGEDYWQIDASWAGSGCDPPSGGVSLGLVSRHDGHLAIVEPSPNHPVAPTWLREFLELRAGG